MGRHYMRKILRIRTSIIIILIVQLMAGTISIRMDQSQAQDRPAEGVGEPASPVIEATESAETDSSLNKKDAHAPHEEVLKVPLTEVIGTGPEALEHIPGSGRVITQKEIWENHRLTVNEALREVPGVNVRDEDGLGLRPNIGIRGLDPTRSRKVHIMEDGVPIMLMPYGDPSSYYFPPIFRMDRIEVLKGSGQLLYGPQSIGGVINLITRMPPPHAARQCRVSRR